MDVIHNRQTKNWDPQLPSWLYSCLNGIKFVILAPFISPNERLKELQFRADWLENDEAKGEKIDIDSSAALVATRWLLSITKST